MAELTETELEPITVTVQAAQRISGFGHSKIFEFIKDGRLKAKKVDGRRLVNYASLKALLTD